MTYKSCRSDKLYRAGEAFRTDKSCGLCRRFPYRRPNGFTIVEVLIAIAVLASLVSVTWVSMNSLYKSRDMMAMRGERYQQVRGVFDRLSHELSAAFIAGPDLGGEKLPGGNTGKAPPSNVDQAVDADKMAQRTTQTYGLVGTSNRINFTTMGHRQTQLNERSSYASEIGYFLRPTDVEGERTNQLMRREDVTIDDRLERGGVVFSVLPDVKDIEFEYWDPGPVKLGTYEELANGRWVKEWDTRKSSHAGRLPSRVKVTLTLPPQGVSTRPEVFSTQIPIATTEVMEF